MSRWVRCSYGKRAGFVGAKIGFISESSKLFETFLPIFAPKVVSLCDIWADAKPFLMVNSIGVLALEGLIVFHFVQRY